MTYLEKITGKDIENKYKEYKNTVDKFPVEYQIAWNDINDKLSMHTDFTGRNLLHILDSVLDMLVEMNDEGRTVEQIFGGDIEGFCKELTNDLPSFDVRDKWRKKLNKKIEKRFSK